MKTIILELTDDQARHLDMLLVDEIRELQDTTRLTDHNLYELRIAFNHRIGSKIRTAFKKAGAELVKT